MGFCSITFAGDVNVYFKVPMTSDAHVWSFICWTSGFEPEISMIDHYIAIHIAMAIFF